MEHKYITVKGECETCKHKGKKGGKVKAKPAKAAAKAVVDAFNRVGKKKTGAYSAPGNKGFYG